MRVYLSGPITGDPKARQRFARAEQFLRSKGQTDIINPEATLHGLTMEHKEYMHVCQALLELSDVMLLLPGWRDSRGACLEIGIALANKIRIYELIGYKRARELNI